VKLAAFGVRSAAVWGRNDRESGCWWLEGNTL